MNKIELLAPAGSLLKCKIAMLYGADAVYIGGKKYSLRARANNFTLEDIKEAAKFASCHNKKLYVTMNIVAHNEDNANEKELIEYLKYLESVGVSAIITSSLYVSSLCLQFTPMMEVHLSTQLSTTNSYACNVYKQMGIKRIVLGREVSLQQMAQIRKNTDVELEVFIHGGMCSAFSGRCMLSNHMVNRDANRGGCAHSCRWNYYLHDENNVSKEIFNIGSKDLNSITLISEMINNKIDSLKIEGRMKSEYYLGTIIKCYRQVIDSIYNNLPIDYESITKEISKAENRATSTGNLLGDATHHQQLYTRDETPTKEFVGLVIDYNEKTKEVTLEQRNYFKVGDKVEFFGPTITNYIYVIPEIFDVEGTSLECANHPKQIIRFVVPIRLQKYDMMRLIK